MLVPREHGAYGQLLFPLLSALLIGHPAPGAWLLGGAAIGAFLAHEGLLVLLGHRGRRAAREERDDARRALALFGGFALVTGVVALAVLPAPALLGLIIPAVMALLVTVAVLTRRERTVAGEVVVAVTLSSVAVPMALAGEVTVVAALTLFFVFSFVFVTATVAVRSMIGRVTKAGGPPPLVAAILALTLVGVLAWLARQGRVAPVAPYAALPVVLVALGLSAKPPAPRHLRTIGWTLVGATLATAVILVSALA